MKTLVLATRNPGKVREFSQLLAPLGYTVITAAQAGYDEEPEETGTTFRENAAIKARAVFEGTGGDYAVLSDDSGLAVDALGGAPGVYSARYAGPGGTDDDNNKKLLKELNAVTSTMVGNSESTRSVTGPSTEVGNFDFTGSVTGPSTEVGNFDFTGSVTGSARSLSGKPTSVGPSSKGRTARYQIALCLLEPGTSTMGGNSGSTRSVTGTSTMVGNSGSTRSVTGTSTMVGNSGSTRSVTGTSTMVGNSESTRPVTGEGKARSLSGKSSSVGPSSKGGPVFFEGACEGVIGFEERGTGGFGYDVLFIPTGEDGKPLDGRTFAEMTAEEKHPLSHRGKAVAKLLEFLHGR